MRTNIYKECGVGAVLPTSKTASPTNTILPMLFRVFTVFFTVFNVLTVPETVRGEQCIHSDSTRDRIRLIKELRSRIKDYVISAAFSIVLNSIET
jgi:hypothetical protein